MKIVHYKYCSYDNSSNIFCETFIYMGNTVLAPGVAECTVMLICDSFSLAYIDAMQMVMRETRLAQNRCFTHYLSQLYISNNDGCVDVCIGLLRSQLNVLPTVLIAPRMERTNVTCVLVGTN